LLLPAKETTYLTPLALTIDVESKLDDYYNIGSKIEKVEATTLVFG
jgi:hypothetical protein